MHYTPCPGPTKYSLMQHCHRVQFLKAMHREHQPSDIIISNLCHTLDSVVDHFQDNLACIIGVQLKFRELIFSLVTLNFADSSTTIGALPDCSAW